MSEKKFSNKEAIKYGWESMKEHLGFFLIIGVIILAVSVIPDIAKEIMKKNDSSSLKVILNTISLLFQVVALLLEIGFVKITLKLFKKEKVSVSDLFSQYHLFFKYLGASILYVLIVMGGFILFIVPSFIWGIKFMLFPYFIVEGYGVIESLKKSAEITAGSKWDLFIFNALLSLISLAGILAFGIGILIAIPIVSMAAVFVYQKLKIKEKIKVSEELLK
jgi:uncharacterized membrane protein